MARQDRIRRASRHDGDVRLQQAEAFLEQAELSVDLIAGPGRGNAVVSSAVLAAIAAADAATAYTLAEVSGGAHDQATKLLGRVAGSTKAVSDLSRLLSLKTAAQYSSDTIRAREIDDALNRARRIIAFARSLHTT